MCLAFFIIDCVFGVTIITSILTLDNIYLCALGVNRSFVFCRAVSQILFWLQIARNIRTKQTKNTEKRRFFIFLREFVNQMTIFFKKFRKQLEVIY